MVMERFILLITIVLFSNMYCLASKHKIDGVTNKINDINGRLKNLNEEKTTKENILSAISQMLAGLTQQESGLQKQIEGSRKPRNVASQTEGLEEQKKGVETEKNGVKMLNELFKSQSKDVCVKIEEMEEQKTKLEKEKQDIIEANVDEMLKSLPAKQKYVFSGFDGLKGDPGLLGELQKTNATYSGFIDFLHGKWKTLFTAEQTSALANFVWVNITHAKYLLNDKETNKLKERLRETEESMQTIMKLSEKPKSDIITTYESIEKPSLNVKKVYEDMIAKRKASLSEESIF